MAKEETTKGGVFIPVAVAFFMIGCVGSVIALAWTGGSRVTAVEKDVETAIFAGDENKTKIKDIRKDVDSNYKELKEESNEAKLRDERQSTQYSAILNHMTQQTEINRGILTRLDEASAADQAVQISITRVEGRLNGVETKVDNLQKVD
jgi:hypothetical protein